MASRAIKISNQVAVLYPRLNANHQIMSLPSFWEFYFESEDTALATGWQTAFQEGRSIAVSARWIDQVAKGRVFLRPDWYQTV